MSKRTVLALVALVAFLVYANALANGFVLDDRGVIMRNALVTTPSSWWRAFIAPYWPAAVGAGQYRPLAIASFALDWAVSGGATWWFHLVTVAWHVAATVLVARFALELMSPAGALAAGLLFAVHPVHVEAVANNVGRAECMAAAGVLAALLLHRHGSWMAIPVFAAALFAKENALVFLPLAALHDVLIPARPRDRITVRRYLAYGGVAILWIGVVAAIFLHHSTFSLIAPAYVNASTAERLWTVLTVVPQYARLLIFPWDLSAGYEPQVIPLASGLSASAVAGLFLLGVTGVAAGLAWRRSKAVAFALLWIPIAIAPVSNVLVITGVSLAERTLYMASIGACWLGGLAVDLLARRRVVRLIPVAALGMAFAVRTWTRTPTWRDDRVFLVTLISTHPESYWAHFLAGGLFVAKGDLDAASRELKVSRSLYALDVGVWCTSAEVALDRGAFDEARGLIDSVRALAPKDLRVVALQARLNASP